MSRGTPAPQSGSTTAAAGTPPEPFAEPTARVGGGWIALFAAAWLGIWMAQLTPIQLLLPLQIESRVGAVATGAGTGTAASSDWIASVLAFGIISGIAGVAALVVFPLTGALSDRTTSRFGRRRPWLAAGTLLFAASLVLLGLQTSLFGIGVFWTLTITGFCILTAALTATISDQVPVAQRGAVSGWLAAPQAVGTILGLILVTTLFTAQFAGYLVVAVLLVVLVLPFCLRVPDAVLERSARARVSARGFLDGFWISPKAHPDFGFTLLGRVLVNTGNALGTALLLYFLMFGLHDDTAEDDLIVLTLIYMVFVVLASLGAGVLSDRLGRRRVFVFVASICQAAAALLLALVPELGVAMVAAGLLGLGYGCFLSVDQALATQVLPDPAARGKDLGIMNIATAVPQAIAPLLGAAVVALSGGFMALFLLSALFAAAGALAVARVRGVR
ncbi:MFS transporter [Subtercola boreus]|uniref:MFS transporter n=1 Tax=Subtercola boreus TaxID=120213 RepID=A0A3E0VMS0_9MICO|nr:MFS transporter [Subtercola boreus]RFA11242.1 MFS transporter [Subtercola boreus]TQL53110.1 MFS transporter [Subtercola boreus]